MALIKALVGGAAAETQISENFMPEIIQVGPVDEDSVLTKIAWSFNGYQRGLISGQTFVQAFSKLGRAGLLGADVKVSQGFTLADGQDVGKFEMTLTNVGATTPNIYGWSRSASGFDIPGKGGRHITAATIAINANSKFEFSKFLAVVFDPTNLDNAQITFNRMYPGNKNKEKFRQKFLPAELPGLFTLDPGNFADADGKLAGYTVIENFRGLVNPELNISSVELYAGAAALTVLFVSSIDE